MGGMFACSTWNYSLKPRAMVICERHVHYTLLVCQVVCLVWVGMGSVTDIFVHNHIQAANNIYRCCFSFSAVL